MTLAKLQEVIRLKQRPETTLSLETTIQQGKQTVAHYRFTPSIRDYFSEILSLATSDRGQGYWIQAEYGAGNTHFLATLAVLVADRRGVAGMQVKDDLTACPRSWHASQPTEHEVDHGHTDHGVAGLGEGLSIFG